MYSYIFAGFLILTTVSCQNRQHKIPDEIVKTDANITVAAKPEESGANTDELVEFFSDDSKIGSPHKNKIEISNFKKPDSDTSKFGNLATVKFYSLDANRKWKLKQIFEFDKDSLTDCDPKLKDFNNDGYKDITYVSDVAARGANELRKLFIYDKKKDELIYIKNSEHYPNMLYNKKLNCIDAFLVTGATSTVFLKINGDSLEEFAKIQNSEISGRTIYLIDKKGKEKLVRTDKIKADDIFARYKNFNPPEQ